MQAKGDFFHFFLYFNYLKNQFFLGYSIVADKINNMRFLSHFRSIHRGAYFAEMKTTTVRKLLPE
jgi:DNA-directed RNA polymerase beta subunit